MLPRLISRRSFLFAATVGAFVATPGSHKEQSTTHFAKKTGHQPQKSYLRGSHAQNYVPLDRQKQMMQPIQLFTAATMNGYKASIVLEELGIPYTFKYIQFSKKEQKSPWYEQINPNGRIPAIVDPNHNDYALAESAAILMYLCETYDPTNSKGLFVDFRNTSDAETQKRMKIVQWLMFQMSGIGPIMGNAMYFQRIAKPKGINDEFGITRFVEESSRLLMVLNRQLEQHGPYIMGDTYTIADIACYPYVKSAYWATVDLSEFAAIRRWLALIDKRPAVIKGLTIPKENRHFFGESESDSALADAIAVNASEHDIPK